jgi:hypothetical protein
MIPKASDRAAVERREEEAKNNIIIANRFFLKYFIIYCSPFILLPLPPKVGNGIISRNRGLLFGDGRIPISGQILKIVVASS